MGGYAAQHVDTVKNETRGKGRLANQNTNTAHTISQRLRTLKKIPPELIPLGVVLAVAVGAAAYALIRKLYVDKTLRLYRTGKQH